MSEGSVQPGEDAFQWQQSRRRPDGHFDIPATGFGPSGQYTLWLPSSATQTRWVFREGRPVRELLESCMTTPAIMELREKVIRAMTADTLAGRLTADENFLHYAATVVGMNYVCSDDDLSFLLDGTAWHNDIVNHLIGGDGFVELLSRLTPRIIVDSPPPAASKPAPPPAPPTRSRWARLAFWR